MILGPTGVGKTALSLSLAERLKADIVSADSRQIYRFLDIGTAKPTKSEQEHIPHHFINIRDPDQYYSAGEYGRAARQCIKTLLQAGKTPIVVGGSGFYIQALVDGLFAPNLSDPAIKDKWRGRIRERGKEYVFEELRKVDPVSAGRIHPNDIQRIVRALEVWELSGKPISAFRHGENNPAEFEPLLFALFRERDILYRRIDARVDHMLREGLVEEVKDLVLMGYHRDYNSLRTVGYQEVFEYLDGTLSYDNMVEAIKRNSRQYAKRQLTWFRRDRRIFWLDMEKMNEREIEELILSS